MRSYLSNLLESKTIDLVSFPFSRYDALFLIDLDEIVDNHQKVRFGKIYPDDNTLKSEFDNFVKNLYWFGSEYKRRHNKGIMVGRICSKTAFRDLLDLTWETNKNQLPKNLKKKLDEKNVKTGLVAGLYAFHCVDDFCNDNRDDFCLTIISNLTFPLGGRSFNEEQLEKEQLEEEQRKEEQYKAEQLGHKFEESNNNLPFELGASFPIAFPRRICVDPLPYSTPILDNKIMKCQPK